VINSIRILPTGYAYVNTSLIGECNATDPDGDAVYYYFDWGDGGNSGWLGPYASGASGCKDHSYSSEGTYTIKAKAKDNNIHATPIIK
jgi:hypothetical protein